MEKIRIGGAQIPCTDNLNRNVDILKSAIDWAYNNKVNYLLTPEGSLSGYVPNFYLQMNEIRAAEKEIVDYAASKSVGLILGTMWLENGHKQNQQRFYNPDGAFAGKTNKTYTIPYDDTVPNDYIDNVRLKYKNAEIDALGLICNDFWGGPTDGKIALPLAAQNLNSNILLHSTNGFRGSDPDYESMMNAWHDANLRMFSWAIKIPIVTADNCYSMDGKEYNGPTSSESGILLGGKWITNVPRIGIQYFYHDFELPKLLMNAYMR